MNTYVSDLTSANVSNVVDASEEKRYRTSPRTNAFEEVLAIVKEYVKQQEEIAEKVSDLDARDVEARIEAAEYLRSRVEDMIGTKHNGNAYEGRHYIGLTHEGTKEVFQHHAKPSSRTHGKKYVSVAGPFRKKAECDVLVREGIAPKNVLFGNMR